jgi:integrase
MREPEIGAFISALATERRVAASTQNQALSAVLFLYREVLLIELTALPEMPRAVMPVRVPVVLTASEVRQVIAQMTGVAQLVARLLYGAGLRLLECLEVRVKDVDFERSELTVRRGKGQKRRRGSICANRQSSVL